MVCLEFVSLVPHSRHYVCSVPAHKFSGATVVVRSVTPPFLHVAGCGNTLSGSSLRTSSSCTLSSLRDAHPCVVFPASCAGGVSGPPPSVRPSVSLL